MDSRLYLIDSCVIIAYFRKDERDHAKAVKWIEELEEFVISDYILAEVATTLRNKEGLDVAEKALRYLVFNENIKVMRITEEELGETIAFFMQNGEKISFIDASLLVMSKARRVTTVSFDKDLVRAGALLH